MQNFYNSAVTLTNASAQSQKHLSAHAVSSHMAYFGIALRSSNNGFQRVVSVLKLTRSGMLNSSAFFLQEDDWFTTVNGYKMPVSEQVQVYIEPTDRWLSGPEGVKTAVSSGLPLTIHYDKTLTSGAVARVIVVEDQT